MNKQSIIDYYEECHSDYHWLWDLSRSQALHLGYWDASTHSLTDALRRENEVLAEWGEIQSGDTVLDAGCGVGGSSFFLAERYGCHVKGITLSRKQWKEATLKEKPPAGHVEFFLMDYTRTDFPDHAFDVVWAIESLCHCQEKEDFFGEAYRLLKPGGKILIADAFLTEKGEAQEEERMQRWLNGWGGNKLCTVDYLKEQAELKGFTSFRSKNVTSNMMPSSRMLYRWSFPIGILSKMGEWVGMRSKKQTANVSAAYYQHLTLQQGLWEYDFVSVIKPNSTSGCSFGA